MGGRLPTCQTRMIGPAPPCRRSSSRRRGATWVPYKRWWRRARTWRPSGGGSGDGEHVLIEIGGQPLRSLRGWQRVRRLRVEQCRWDNGAAFGGAVQARRRGAGDGGSEGGHAGARCDAPAGGGHGGDGADAAGSGGGGQLREKGILIMLGLRASAARTTVWQRQRTVISLFGFASVGLARQASCLFVILL